MLLGVFITFSKTERWSLLVQTLLDPGFTLFGDDISLFRWVATISLLPPDTGWLKAIYRLFSLVQSPIRYPVTHVHCRAMFQKPPLVTTSWKTHLVKFMFFSRWQSTRRPWKTYFKSFYRPCICFKGLWIDISLSCLRQWHFETDNLNLGLLTKRFIEGKVVQNPTFNNYFIYDLYLYSILRSSKIVYGYEGIALLPWVTVSASNCSFL